MRIPVYDGEKVMIPVMSVSRQVYPIAVNVIEPIAIVEIMSNGMNINVVNRWQLLKLLILG